MVDKFGKCPKCGGIVEIVPNRYICNCENCKNMCFKTELLPIEIEEQLVKTEEVSQVETKPVKDDTVYHAAQIENLISLGKIYIEKADFERAEDCYRQITELNAADYRGWFGLAKAVTKNFTCQNTTHHEYFEKALELADSSQESMLYEEYAPMYDVTAPAEDIQEEIQLQPFTNHAIYKQTESVVKVKKEPLSVSERELEKKAIYFAVYKKSHIINAVFAIMITLGIALFMVAAFTLFQLFFAGFVILFISMMFFAGTKYHYSTYFRNFEPAVCALLNEKEMDYSMLYTIMGGSKTSVRVGKASILMPTFKQYCNVLDYFETTNEVLLGMTLPLKEKNKNKRVKMK